MSLRQISGGVGRRLIQRIWLSGGVLTVGLLGVLIAAGQSAASTVPGRPGAPPGSAPFAWLATSAAPSDWPRFVLPSGLAQLSYPPTMSPLPGDTGTASAALRDATGRFLAYVNVTPRQGNETLKGFGVFRLRLLRNENQTVSEDAAVEGLAFGGGLGSCVIDHYVTRIGHHRYREIACFVEGRHGGAVVVAASTLARWREFEPLLRDVAASFTVR